MNLSQQTIIRHRLGTHAGPPATQEGARRTAVESVVSSPRFQVRDVQAVGGIPADPPLAQTIYAVEVGAFLVFFFFFNVRCCTVSYCAIHLLFSLFNFYPSSG